MLGSNTTWQVAPSPSHPLRKASAPSADAGIGFEVDNVDAMVATLRAKGTTVNLEPFPTPVCRMAVILDPEGNALTLQQATQSW
jgi:predicted enzyme related to lactoylglutathione lyase